MGFLGKVGKAALAGTGVVLGVTYGAPKLPDKLKVGGVDLRPYLVSTAVMLGVFMLPVGVKPSK